MGFLNSLIAIVLEYDTVKYITVKNKKIGLLNRVIQLGILGYIIGYAIIYQKGYQDFSDIESAVTTKVKGVIYTNFSENEFAEGVDPTIYNRVWDVTDYVVPPSENNALFVATNVVITPSQKRSKCPEDDSIVGASCDPRDNTCEKGKILYLGNGPMTGKCVENGNQTYSCQIMAWCPLEQDIGPLKSGGILDDVRKSTVLIKNFISFPKHGVTRRNVLDTSNVTYLNSCHYHPETDQQCPVFVIDDIIKGSGENFSQVAVKGGVFAININWECNLDFSPKKCIPTYSFKRLDEPDAKLAKGWNFRYANYYMNNNRALYKLYGIDFVVLVTGRGGKFNFIPLLLNIGSGVGLLAAATVIADLAVLYCVKKRQLYKTKKYVEVETEYDGFHDVSARENEPPSDFSYQRQP